MTSISKTALIEAADRWKARRLEEVEAEYRQLVRMAEKLGANEAPGSGVRRTGVIAALRRVLPLMPETFTMRQLAKSAGVEYDGKSTPPLAWNFIKRGELVVVHKGRGMRDPNLYAVPKASASTNGQPEHELTTA
jgi:hypothetical protein